VVLEIGVVSLEEGLVGSLAASDDANHASAGALDGSSHTRWKSDAGLLAVFGVADDDSRATGGTGEGAAVSLLAFKVGNDCAFGHLGDGKYITNGESGFGTRVDKLAGVHSFNSDEILSAVLVSVLVSENNFGKRSATSSIVDDVLDSALDVAAR